MHRPPVRYITAPSPDEYPFRGVQVLSSDPIPTRRCINAATKRVGGRFSTRASLSGAGGREGGERIYRRQSEREGGSEEIQQGRAENGGCHRGALCSPRSLRIKALSSVSMRGKSSLEGQLEEKQKCSLMVDSDHVFTIITST